MEIVTPLQSIALIGGVVLLLFLAERMAPLRVPGRPLLARLIVNGAMSLGAFAAATAFVRPAALGVLRWSDSSQAGLIHHVRSPTAQFVLACLLMDVTFYWWHVANHRIALLWRFHNVHHIDPDLDVSTAFRFHCGEVALSSLFRAAQVAVIGLPLWMYATYELVFQAGTAFHHSNLRLPVRVERLLNLVLVTPRMHGIHHSQVRDETNSNYSVVFSWWDRLHGTAMLNVRQATIIVGVPAYMSGEDNRLLNTLLLPFRRQREYWRRADGTVAPPATDAVRARKSLAE